MGRPRNPEHDKSLQRFLDSDGKITIAELARLAGVPANRVRKWKSEDNWEEQLKNKPKKRGGQKGNRNATGKTPAKKNNKNAVTHGAFAQAGYEDIDKEAAERIQTMSTPRALDEMMKELQALYIRKEYLEGLLKQYESQEASGFYADKIIHMIVPKSVEDKAIEDNMGMRTQTVDPEGTGEQEEETFKTAMKSIVKSSSFDRAMKIEDELNKLHGRIIKQLDSIKAYEIEDRRITLEEKKFNLLKQKVTGEFDIDPETGEIVDDMDEQFDEVE